MKYSNKPNLNLNFIPPPPSPPPTQYPSSLSHIIQLFSPLHHIVRYLGNIHTWLYGKSIFKPIHTYTHIMSRHRRKRENTCGEFRFCNGTNNYRSSIYRNVVSQSVCIMNIVRSLPSLTSIVRVPARYHLSLPPVLFFFLFFLFFPPNYNPVGGGGGGFKC